MKKNNFLYIFSFSLMGVLFPFVMMLIGNLMGVKEQGMQMGGEDELNERLKLLLVYFLSTSVFLWASVGYFWSLSKKLGLKALSALLLGILLNKIMFKVYYFYFAKADDFKTTLIVTSLGWVIYSALSLYFLTFRPKKRALF